MKNNDLNAYYEKSLKAVIAQLRAYMGREDINIVIARISPFSNGVPAWDQIRKMLVAVAESDSRGAWIDTDDIDRDEKDIHYSRKGYPQLAKRFAEKAIGLIKAKSK